LVEEPKLYRIQEWLFISTENDFCNFEFLL